MPGQDDPVTVESVDPVDQPDDSLELAELTRLARFDQVRFRSVRSIDSGQVRFIG